MKHSTRETTDHLLNLHEECNERLNDQINALVIYIENFSEASKIDVNTAEHLSDNIKEWMNLYHSWINNSLDAILETLK